MNSPDEGNDEGNTLHACGYDIRMCCELSGHLLRLLEATSLAGKNNINTMTFIISMLSYTSNTALIVIH